jgi:AcrR family transcriptional regulator
MNHLHLPGPRRPRPEPRITAAVRSALPALCRERGFRNLTVADICRRAAISEAEFNRSYSDLEDCFTQLYEDFSREFLLRMLAAFDADLTWREQIRAVAYSFLGYLEEDPDRAHFTVVDALNAGERAQLVRDSVFAALFALIDQGRSEPGAPAGLTPATAESVGGAIFLQMRLAIEAGRFEELEGTVPQMMYQVVLPYLGPEAAAEELEIPPPALVGAKAGDA